MQQICNVPLKQRFKNGGFPGSWESEEMLQRVRPTEVEW
jgi:hypothetical protein